MWRWHGAIKLPNNIFAEKQYQGSDLYSKSKSMSPFLFYFLTWLAFRKTSSDTGLMGEAFTPNENFKCLSFLPQNKKQENQGHGFLDIVIKRKCLLCNVMS